MDPSFWHERWSANRIAFHEPEVNRLLVAHLDALAIAPGGRVFLPLCGKTLDIPWLLARGHRVVGVELSPLAVAQLFAEMGVTPRTERVGDLELHRADGLDVFVGDIFDLTGDVLGPVDAVFDRAALVALPPRTRGRYAAHLAAITGGAPRLLVTFEYDQATMPGPPFSVTEAEVRRLHGDRHHITRLATGTPPGGLHGRLDVLETAWLLTDR